MHLNSRILNCRKKLQEFSISYSITKDTIRVRKQRDKSPQSKIITVQSPCNTFSLLCLSNNSQVIGVEYYHILYFLESCEKTPFEIQSFAELLSIRNRWLPNWMNMVRDNLEPHDAEAEISEAETMHTAASAFFETNNDLLLIPEPVLRTLVHAWRYDVSPSNYIH